MPNSTFQRKKLKSFGKLLVETQLCGLIHFTSTFPKSKISNALIKKVPFNTVLILFEIQKWGDTGNIYILATFDYVRNQTNILSRKSSVY